MYRFNKKQKIILGIIIVVLIAAVTYYIYTKDEEQEIIPYTEEIKESEVEKNKTYSDSTIIVHVSGSVANEGIVELKVNSRVSDAIEKAGGLKEDANVAKINLAYILEDGMKIYIPSINDKEEISETENIPEKDETEKYATKDSGVVSNSNSNTSKVNINSATQTELETLPGIGPSTAVKIINYRNENGKFNNIDDIKNVNGIGDNKFNNIKDLICVK